MIKIISQYLSRQKRGFTLIELLVVIAIIGILASIVLASLNSARRKSRDARRIADVKQLQLALELYFDANTNVYPAALATLSGATACGSQACIPVVPNDPLGAAYLYEQQGTTSYVLGGTLEEDTNPALDADVDGTVGTINCGVAGGGVDTPPVYCVRP